MAFCLQMLTQRSCCNCRRSCVHFESASTLYNTSNYLFWNKIYDIYNINGFRQFTKIINGLTDWMLMPGISRFWPHFSSLLAWLAGWQWVLPLILMLTGYVITQGSLRVEGHNWEIKIVFGSWGFLSVTWGLMFISNIDSHIITNIQRSQNWKVNYEWELVYRSDW